MGSLKKNTETALEMISVSKVFGNVKALDDVSFSCKNGEVHGLVGENGAGKSTLMKILAGEYRPDEGTIYIRGEKTVFKNPRQSKEKGISLIHQEFSLVPFLNVAENLFLGKEPRGLLGFINTSALYRGAKEALKQLNIELDLHVLVAQLTIAERQLLEIAKAIQENPQILIMDEPTAALERNEVETLFSLIKTIKSQGRTVIFISHRLEEVFEITDKTTVLRNGTVVSTVQSDGVTKDELIELIIGRKLEKFFPPKSKKIGKELVEVKALARDDKIKDINLTLREGEILGVAGLEGQGQHALLRAIFGADLSLKKSGSVTFKSKTVDLTHPQHTVRSGFGYVPSDRQAEGLAMNLAVADNMSLPGLSKRAKSGWIDNGRENDIVDKNIKVLSIKVPSRDIPVKQLSGGNQQKIVLSKWLASDTEIFIFDEPTRGVNVGTRADIYRLMRDLADQGKGIIISSRDLDEVIGMSDRIALIYRGRIIKEYEASSVSKQEILDIITRIPQEEKRPSDDAQPRG